MSENTASEGVSLVFDVRSRAVENVAILGAEAFPFDVVPRRIELVLEPSSTNCMEGRVAKEFVLISCKFRSNDIQVSYFLGNDSRLNVAKLSRVRETGP